MNLDKLELMHQRLAQMISSPIIQDSEYCGSLRKAKDRLGAIIAQSICRHEHTSKVRHPTPYGDLVVEECKECASLISAKLDR